MLADGPRAHRPARPGSRCPGRTCRCSTRPRSVDAAKGGYVLRGGLDRARPRSSSSPPAPRCRWRSPARERLEAEGTPTRVVSMPCLEWFDAQDAAYQQQVLPPDVKARVSIEAGVPQGWREIVGDAGEIVAIDHFGASADGRVLFEQFGFTPDRVVAAAHAALERVGTDHAARPPATEGEQTMSDALADLSGAGRVDLARRHQPRAAAHRATCRSSSTPSTSSASPATRRSSRRRWRRATAYDEQMRDLARPRGRARRRRSGYLMAYDIRWACDVLRPVYDAHRRAWTAGSRSRSTRASRTTPTRRSPRPRACGGWSTGPNA